MEIHRMQRLNSQRAIPSTAVLFEALALQMLHQIFQVESTSKTTQWPPIMSQTPTTKHKRSTSTPWFSFGRLEAVTSGHLSKPQDDEEYSYYSEDDSRVSVFARVFGKMFNRNIPSYSDSVHISA